MGEFIPEECITNVLHENMYTYTLSSADQDWVQMWEEWKVVVDHTAALSKATAEPMQEDKEE